ncbi:hypothetical protein L2E82_19755 [Cichorium intybus]|uniref:Uncharacterized protein n=1 Tax=Cichorium intybus TaxID=13427 RepID=A0ACB9DS55_CICIN|nr:hypothetical protein L2E82_19755 [Cichorium intybus]
MDVEKHYIGNLEKIIFVEQLAPLCLVLMSVRHLFSLACNQTSSGPATIHSTSILDIQKPGQVGVTNGI